MPEWEVTTENVVVPTIVKQKASLRLKGGLSLILDYGEHVQHAYVCVPANGLRFKSMSFEEAQRESPAYFLLILRAAVEELEQLVHPQSEPKGT